MLALGGGSGVSRKRLELRFTTTVIYWMAVLDSVCFRCLLNSLKGLDQGACFQFLTGGTAPAGEFKHLD